MLARFSMEEPHGHPLRAHRPPPLCTQITLSVHTGHTLCVHRPLPLCTHATLSLRESHLQDKDPVALGTVHSNALCLGSFLRKLTGYDLQGSVQWDWRV